MLTGFFILKAAGSAKYTPSFPRGGLAAVFSVQVFELVGSPTSLTVTVEHKNIEDTTFASAGSFSSITSAGTATLDLSGLKEQLRFALTVAATNSWEGFYMLIAAPAWRPY